MPLFTNDDDYPTNPTDETNLLAHLDDLLRVRPTSPRWQEA